MPHYIMQQGRIEQKAANQSSYNYAYTCANKVMGVLMS